MGGGGYNSDPWLIISHLRVCNPLRFLQYLWSKFPVRKFSGSAPCTRMHYFADAMEHVGNKRTCYISWDEYFMGVALISAERSKDPVTQVFTTFHVEFTRLFCNEKYILILHFTIFLVKVCQEIVLTSAEHRFRLEHALSTRRRESWVWDTMECPMVVAMTRCRGARAMKTLSTTRSYSVGTYSLHMYLYLGWYKYFSTSSPVVHISGHPMYNTAKFYVY